MIALVLRVCALLALSSVAYADPKAADKLAEEANARAKQGDFAGAAAKFRAAHAAEPRAELICNVGVSYFKAKDLLRAQRYLTDCLAVGASVPPAFVATVKQVLAQLEDQLRAGPYSPISIVVSPPQTAIAVVGGAPYDEPAIGSRVLWFPRAQVSLELHADGYVDQVRAIDASTPQTVSVSLERTPVAVVVAPPPPPPPPPQQPPRSLLRPTVLTVAAAGEGVAALAFYLLARGKAKDANGETDFGRYTKDKDAAHTYQLVAIVGAGTAAITAGIAGYFWHRDLRVEPTPGGAVVAVGGRF